jgi:hypothetical protein
MIILKMDIREIECEGAHWVQVAWDRDQWWVFVNTVIELLLPYNVISFAANAMYLQ